MELYKHNSKEQINLRLWEDFGHPGILLFRGRELEALNRYTVNNPLGIQKRVLDLGCGEGNIGSIVFNKIDVGLDMSFDDARKAFRRGIYKNLIVTDARNMPFQDGAFDIVFSNSVIEHIKDIDRVLGEVSRVLTEGGLFIFTVPSNKFTQCLGWRLYSALRNRQLKHFNLLNESGWQERLGHFCFDVIYRDSYLSEKEIVCWDKICISLRLARGIPFVRRILKRRFYNRAIGLLREEPATTVGAGLLIVARRRH